MRAVAVAKCANSWFLAAAIAASAHAAIPSSGTRAALLAFYNSTGGNGWTDQGYEPERRERNRMHVVRRRLRRHPIARGQHRAAEQQSHGHASRHPCAHDGVHSICRFSTCIRTAGPARRTPSPAPFRRSVTLSGLQKFFRLRQQTHRQYSPVVDGNDLPAKHRRRHQPAQRQYSLADGIVGTCRNSPPSTTS